MKNTNFIFLVAKSNLKGSQILTPVCVVYGLCKLFHSNILYGKCLRALWLGALCTLFSICSPLYQENNPHCGVKTGWLHWPQKYLWFWEFIQYRNMCSLMINNNDNGTFLPPSVAPCSSIMLDCSRPDPPSLLEALRPVFNQSSIRPVMNASTPTYVSINFILVGILGVVRDITFTTKQFSIIYDSFWM